MSAASIRPRSAADCLIRSAVDISHPRQQGNPPASSSVVSGSVRSNIIIGLGVGSVGGDGNPSLVSSMSPGVVPGTVDSASAPPSTGRGNYLPENPAKMAEKSPRFGRPWPSWELAWTMNWVDWLRTSADKQMWSGRRAVVMRTGRRAELLGVKLGCPRSRCRAVVSDVLCVRSYVHFVCVCVYMCMCVCVRT